MTINKKFQGEKYKVMVTAKNITLTPALEKHIFDKIAKIDHFADHILDVNVNLDIQKVTNTVSISMKFLHFKIKVQAQTEDMYSAIDKAVEKLIKLIKKYKTKLQKHHKIKESPNLPMRVAILRPVSDLDEINDQISAENLQEDETLYKIHDVVTTESRPLRMLTQDEAAMRFELSGDNFLIFKSQEDQKIKVMYRRSDEKLGIIQVE